MAISEGPMVELKQAVVEDIKKEVVAFANSQGGALYIGITDDGRIVGVDHVDETSLQVSNMIRDGIKPDVTMFVKYSYEVMEGKNIIKVIVQKGTDCPYYIAKKGMRPEGVYVRQGSSSVPASENAIRQMIKETDGDTFENMRSLCQELTFEAAAAEFTAREVAFGESQMVTLGLANADRIYTNLGLLLSDQCLHTIKAASFEGITQSVFKDRREFRGSLLKQMNDAYSFIDMYNKIRAEFSKLHRIDRRDYPEEALREALLNSLVHREYSFSGSTLINIFEDRIEFVSLGGLVKGLTLNDILFGVSQCRNEKLAAVFYRLKLIEAYGTGIQRIMDSYRDSEKKPQIEASDNAFKIVLPNKNVFLPQDILKDSERSIMELAVQQATISRKDVEGLLSVSQTMAGRLLKQLVDKKMLKTIGGGKDRKYTLASHQGWEESFRKAASCILEHASGKTNYGD
ncbi:RNA-binding domain-containing protein [Acetonema longum]|uniref:Transcriptional regulator n=1 Tax=Acetonema longum DSM 6540 TaxID=1009370 RepID=F7NHY2_9FIRM|nr:RNA-binding domain-containing protein [Acetonema longum]EGO64361.1 transcriptional regulator [Acetonema longum DSM 6540]